MIIPLLRSKEPVDNFLSAVSHLKETELTAYIAYLLASFPEYLGSLFLDKRESINEVEVEQITKNQDRYDIVLDTNKRKIVIEAKLGFKQSQKQIAKYLRYLKAKKQKPSVLFLLDNGSYKASSWANEISRNLPTKTQVRFKTWQDIHQVISWLLRSSKAKKQNETAFNIANEIKIFMEGNGMTSIRRKEVYVRDLNGASIELFFKHHIYRSQTKFYNSAQGNAYFAPYFTSGAPEDFAERSVIKIREGISWIAPIKDMQHVQRNGILEYLKAKKHPHYKEAAKAACAGMTARQEILIFTLDEPFLAFLTPITKNRLGFTGAMGSKSFTFKDFFEAAAKGGRQ